MGYGNSAPPNKHYMMMSCRECVQQQLYSLTSFYASRMMVMVPMQMTQCFAFTLIM